jgi:hypothetical protein
MNFLQFIPAKLMLRIQYRLKMDYKLNLKNPKRFTELIQVYKLYYKNPIMINCVDKYKVRAFVKHKGFGSILNELYGVYDSVSQIDFSLLPSEYIVKLTNGGGGNNVFIVNENNHSKIDDIKNEIKIAMKKKHKSAGREWVYNYIKPRIIIEKLLINDENPDSGIQDYKLFCFYGVPKYIVVDVDRFIGHKRNIYDTEWNNLNIQTDCDVFNYEMDKPKELNQLLEVSSVLSSDFPFVRVDLYINRGKIVFGELTFFPWSGYVKFFPESFDYELGSHLKTKDLYLKSEVL